MTFESPCCPSWTRSRHRFPYRWGRASSHCLQQQPHEPSLRLYFLLFLPSETGAHISWAFLNNSLKDTTELQQLCSRYCLVSMLQPCGSTSRAQPQRGLWPVLLGQKVPKWGHRVGEGHQTEPHPQIHLLNTSVLPWSSSPPPGSAISCSGHRIIELQNSLGHRGT